MSVPNAHEVQNYLSIKFNKIFSEREFVCCVLSDLGKVLEKRAQCSVLVFPTLGPTYLRALRYQARFLGLAIFNLTSPSGRFKSLAVCHKDHLLSSTMGKDESSSRRKRPERQLYVPPAQRRSRLQRSANQKCQQQFGNEDIPVTSDCESVTFSLSDLVSSLYSLDIATNRGYHQCAFGDFLNFKDTLPRFSTTKIKLYNFENHPKSNSCKSLFDLSVNENIYSGVLVRAETELELCEFEQVPSIFVRDCANTNENILDLGDLGHFCIVKMNDSQYIHECQQEHNLQTCYLEMKRNLETIKVQNDEVKNQDTIKNQINITNRKSCDKKNDHDQEKEIMRKTKEHINRKSKPIMKYVDDANDMLNIDKNIDSVNNWEDLFDDDGQIQKQLLADVVEKVGNEIRIVKATEDYSAYSSKSMENLEHVVELYNFPSTLETHDLVSAFNDLNSDAMYVKWVDDTHALLVLGSLTQAQRAVSMQSALIKVRPMTAASAVALEVANKSNVEPAMKRPPTNLQTARRLITSHLGTKSKLSKEQMEKEKQDLKKAREMKRLLKQTEKDAWEGNIRSSVK